MEEATNKVYYFEKKCNGCTNSIVEPTEFHIANEESTCAVCLENMFVGSMCHKLTCNHLFHKDCITQWFDKNSVCPCAENHMSKLLIAENVIMVSSVIIILVKYCRLN